MNTTILPAATLPLSVVVPCHNEEKTLPLLLPRLEAACKKAADDFEIIFVNDGSTDDSWGLISSLSATNKSIVGINLARQHGQQIAVTAGLSICKGQRILIIDADLQDPPEMLPQMMQVMDSGSDIVYGKRKKRNGESFFKKFSAHCFYRFMKLAGDVAIPEDAGDFRLINRRVWELFQQMPERQRYLRGMFSWIGFKQTPILYTRQARSAGTTKYPLQKMLSLAMDAISGFSIFPLRLSLWLSLLCGGLALLLLFYVLISWIMNETVTGWTSLSCIMLFFFGLQFFCIGMIGEYVGRIYVESKQRPLFIIDKIIRNEESEAT